MKLLPYKVCLNRHCKEFMGINDPETIICPDCDQKLYYSSDGLEQAYKNLKGQIVETILFNEE